MIRAALMLILLAIAFPAEANSTWSRLWLTPDQRAEKLLQQGDASAAAKEYKDPRRKAYAEMKAGDFKQAASDLGKLHDSDSDYNRGNALAKMGDLKDALDAYDAALKSDPKNHDAQHNRDLAEKAMKQQQQQNSQQKNGQSKNNQSGGKQGNKQGANSAGQGKQGNQSGNSANGANNPSGKQSQSGGKNSSPSGKSGSKSAGENSSAQQNSQAGASGNQAQQNQQKNPGQNKDNADAQSGQGQTGAAAATQQQAGKLAKQSANGQSADEAAQAKKDAEAGLAANKSGAAENRIANAAPADQTAPLSEQQLSKEQWLRSIPDDPGGLLRRKFMIEYMLRQQKAQQ